MAKNEKHDKNFLRFNKIHINLTLQQYVSFINMQDYDSKGLH